jgi:mevalonate kinase
MTMNDVGRASGKVILVGEHAVVYGVPAIAVGIDRGARATARPKAAGEPCELTLGMEDGERLRVVDGEGDEPVAAAFSALVASVRARRALGPVAVEAEADLPAGAGLGCSAALGVAIARACAPMDDDEARAHATAWERVFHGNPSGIDTAVAALGGALVFTRREGGGAVAPLALGAPLVLAVGHSGTASSTRSMVESVARPRERGPERVQKTFDGIAAIVRNARLAIEAGDLPALGKLLDMNQMLLAGLLLSTQEIEAMCAAARAEGALGAKLTGAGGGGCMVALAPAQAVAERVLSAWKRDGFNGFACEVAPGGRPGERGLGTLDLGAR